MTDIRIDQILRRLREQAHPYHDTDPPKHEMRDRLVRVVARDYPALTPEEDEAIVREIRRLARAV